MHNLGMMQHAMPEINLNNLIKKLRKYVCAEEGDNEDDDLDD